MATLTVVGAGAGSGKTHSIAKFVAEKVVGGLDPSKILATTFTRKAAAELKGRIQGRLLSEDRLDPGERIARAARLDLAAIGTVHSIGYQLLYRYAIQLGLSPELRVIEEESSKRLLQDVLGQINLPVRDKMSAVWSRLEQEEPGKLALQLLEKKRGNLISDEDFTDQMLEGVDTLCELLSPEGTIQINNPHQELYSLGKQALETIKSLEDNTKITRGGIRKLNRLVSARTRVWRDFLTASKLKAAKTSGADDCLQDLRAFAAQIRRIADLHLDLRTFVQYLVELTLSLEQAYTRHKQERGLMDFTDLEVEFLRLLKNDSVRAGLASEIELVVVDEFQDTNPIQLALFQSLSEFAEECRWVGDFKQAIYGFRGTDAELMRRVWKTVPETSRERLPSNYRSQAGLVLAANELFTPIFGESCALKPINKPQARGIERWLFTSKNKADDSSALAIGIAQLIEEGIKPGDIAVLVRRNEDGKTFGNSLNELGISSVMELPGLLETRECALVLAGLRIVADRFDSLAAATVVHLLEEPNTGSPEWLNQRLKMLHESDSQESDSPEAERRSRKAPWPGHALLDALDNLDARSLPPSIVLARVLEVMEVGERIRGWGEVPRRGSHLDNLLDLADEYETECQEQGTGATLTGLIQFIETRDQEEEDFILPPEGINAVTVLTYHKSKGLEWPVVVLTGLDFNRKPSLFEPAVSGGSPETGRPLEGRRIRYWPWPFGKDYFGRLISGSGLEDDALASPAGQEMQRLDEEEAQRLLYVGFTRAKERVVLAHRDEKYRWLSLIPGIDSVLDTSGGPGEFELPQFDTTFVVRKLDPEEKEIWKKPYPEESRWRSSARVPAEELKPAISRFHNPSEAPTSDEEFAVSVENLPGIHPFPARLRDEDYQAIGNAIHSYYASLPSLSDLDERGCEEAALRSLKGFGVEGILPPNALVASGERFKAWVYQRFGAASWHTEVPVTAPQKEGGQWVGTVDLVLVQETGDHVIVDHKSAPIPASIAALKSDEFSGQLSAYREAIESQSLVVSDLWIHMPLAGVCVRIEPKHSESNQDSP